MENYLRLLFAPLGLVLFVAFSLAGLLLAALLFALGAVRFVNERLNTEIRTFLFL